MGRLPNGLPDLSPAPDFQGLRIGDSLEVLWTEADAPLPAQVDETTVFGALVTVDPTADPTWSCGPFQMYVTQQCPGGTWAR